MPAENGEYLSTDAERPTTLLVFKTTVDPYLGTISLFRVACGTLKAEDTLTNLRSSGAERMRNLLSMLGNSTENLKELAAGDIGAAAKLSDTRTGDTLTAGGDVRLRAPDVPSPMFSLAVVPRTKLDEEKLSTALRRICDANGWLLILDEVQTGNGRTGRFFAYQHSGCRPDLATTAKGLGNGLPIGVCLARGEAANLFRPGHHGSTFGGNPLACAAAHAVLDALEEGSLIERAAQLGKRLLDGFGKALKGSNRIREIRGKGLMLAIELSEPQPGLAAAGLEAGILINVIGDRILRLLPPLNLSDAEADEIVAKVAALLRAPNP